MDAEKQFLAELEAFRVDSESAAQFFYTFQAIHYMASQDKRLLTRLNWNPMFWNTTMGALRDSSLSALGRVFDQHGESHNIRRLLKFAQDHPQVFSKSALRVRKLVEMKDAPDRVDDYVQDACEPAADDWRRLRKHIGKWEAVYRTNYRTIRHKVVAHRERITELERTDLFAKTSYVELEKVCAFLDAFHEALWQLYHNGRRPVLKYRRYSLRSMLGRGTRTRRGATAGELAAIDAKSFLSRLVSRHRKSTGAA